MESRKLHLNTKIDKSQSLEWPSKLTNVNIQANLVRNKNKTDSMDKCGCMRYAAKTLNGCLRMEKV